MVLRKMLLVCVLVAAAILPLIGCKGSADKEPKGGDTAPAKTSNTTAD